MNATQLLAFRSETSALLEGDHPVTSSAHKCSNFDNPTLCSPNTFSLLQALNAIYFFAHA